MASRVANLAQFNPALTIEHMKAALVDAFRETYGPAETQAEETLDLDAFEHIRARYASWDWRFGETPAFNVSFEHRFDWGCLELLLDVQGGRVSAARCYTDAMDATLAERVESALSGEAYRQSALCARLRALGEPTADELAGWLSAQTL